MCYLRIYVLVLTIFYLFIFLLLQDNPSTTSALKTSTSKSTLAPQTPSNEEKQGSVLLEIRDLDMKKVLLFNYGLCILFLLKTFRLIEI